jgi:hypothetical protein
MEFKAWSSIGKATPSRVIGYRLSSNTIRFLDISYFYYINSPVVIVEFHGLQYQPNHRSNYLKATKTCISL